MQNDVILIFYKKKYFFLNKPAWLVLESLSYVGFNNYKEHIKKQGRLFCINGLACMLGLYFVFLNNRMWMMSHSSSLKKQHKDASSLHADDTLQCS